MADERDEQSEAERLAIARRYRETRGADLRARAEAAAGDPVLAAGEFSSVAFESLAATPILGIFAAVAARSVARRAGMPLDLLVALDADSVYLIARGRPGDAAVSGATVHERFDRSQVRVAGTRPRFMRLQVDFEIAEAAGERRELTLYSTPLRTNPWSAEVVRLLGGQDVPAPLDLDER